MRLLQQFGRNARADRATRQILGVVAEPAPTLDRLRDVIERAECLRVMAPQHYGLCFALGQACERAASIAAWSERLPWLDHALRSYDAAIALAESGNVRGSELIPEAGAAAWEAGFSMQECASFAAHFQAGLLRSAEFRSRDPAAAICHLERIVARLRGYHPARYYLGEAYLLGHEFDEAERVWTAALVLAPNEPTLRAVLRNLPVDRLHFAVKAQDWLRVLEEIERLPPGSVPDGEVWTIAGDAYLALGDRDSARRSWRRALEADPRTVGVRSRLRKLDRLVERSSNAAPNMGAPSTSS